MKYITYLKNKNLSKNTIKSYIRYQNIWIDFLGDNKPTKKLFVNFINKYNKSHSVNSTKLAYCSILSYFKFLKLHKLYMECKDIRMPSVVVKNKTIISIEEFDKIKKQNNNLKQWHKKRDWLIFCFLFITGIRAHELNQINKKNIKDKSIDIVGKGRKERQVFINEYLLGLLENWKPNRLNISRKNKTLSYKQVNFIIKRTTKEYFDKELNPHDLRRSFATNLLRRNVDIKTISILLGHSNINTTSRYMFLTSEEIYDNIKDIF